MPRRVGVAAALLAPAVGMAGACANQAAPPGGPEDRRPPVVVRTEPDTFSLLENLSGRVRFHFDERISERVGGGTLEDAVTVSPHTGEVSVGHGRSSLTVEVEGGFRPGLVYRITLLPVVSDLFGNQLRDPFELVFSTGGQPSPTTVAGQVWDRLSGQGVSRVLVQAVGADSLPHVARSDIDGIYAFRYLPSGAFVVTAFEDLDRDREVDPMEVQGVAPVAVQAGDTLLVDIPVLAPDTTPPVTGSAEALDSVTIVLEFDDYLDPVAPSGEVGVGLTTESGPAPVVARLFHEHEYRAFVGEVNDSLARLDSVDAAARAAAAPQPALDTASTVDSAAVAGSPPGADAPDTTVADSAAAADSLVVGGDSVRVEIDAPPAIEPRRGPPPLAGAARQQSPGAPVRLLPGRRLVGLLDGPLEPGITYDVTVTSVTNINGLGGGGGEATLLRALPEPDSASVAPDSSAVIPDSASVLPDTAAAQPDTAAIR